MNVNAWDATDQIQVLIRSRIDRGRPVDPDTTLDDLVPRLAASDARPYPPTTGVAGRVIDL